MATTKTLSAKDVSRVLHSFADPEKAATSRRFFKTGRGEYGEGDVFLGITVPQQRKVAKQFWRIPLREVQTLLRSHIHEERFTALEILVMQFEKAEEVERKRIVDFYLKNTRYINNWDLVDTSAPYILGEYLITRDRSVLYSLAQSQLIWERRIAMLATFACIKNGESADALAIAKLLMHDNHDLIHKAAGWMLREVGKGVSEKELLKFLDLHAHEMPRTMLRYAIEKLSFQQRAIYMVK